ncbi:hypothetical protein BU15DRAFT_79128 [Melanogaster broomeanus]|nr:hypothetical protein BU15DRAFT_79128 [Melanogaster broomeanus]
MPSPPSMTNHFALFSQPIVDEQKKTAVQDAWGEVVKKVDVEVQCMPDDQEDLEEEKEQWVRNWMTLTDTMWSLVDQAKSLELILHMSDEQMRQMGAADVVCACWKREMNERAAECTASTNELPASQGSLMHEDVGMDNRPTSPPCHKMVLPVIITTSHKASPEPEPAFVLLKGMVNHKEACPKCESVGRRCYGTPGKVCAPCSQQHLGCPKSAKGRGPTCDKAETPSGHPVHVPKAGSSKVSKEPSYEGSDASSDVQIVSSQPKRKHKAIGVSTHDQALGELQFWVLLLEARVKNMQVDLAEISRDLGEVSTALVQLRSEE